MEGIKARFYLGTPIVAQDGIRFDALIMKLMIDEMNNKDNGITFDDIPVTETWKHISLPLYKIQHENGFYYSASHAIFDDYVIYKDRFFKRINTELLMGTNTNNINIGSGKHCSTIKEYEEIHVKYIDFYAYGDVIRIEKLLKNVTSLGGLRKQGLGLVTDFEIRTYSGNKYFGCWLDDTAIRNVPINKNKVSDYIQKMRTGSYKINLIQSRVVPPYHYRYNEGKTMCLGIGSNKINVE